MATNRLLRDLVNEDFVLVRSEWPAAEADALVRALKPGWVIVESPGPAYHVLNRWETLQALAQGGTGASTGEALGLAALPPAPVLDAYAVAENLPELCVVLDGDAVLGFYDSVEGPNHLRGAGDIRYEELAHRLVADFPASLAPGEKATLFARLVTDPDFEPRLEPATEVRLLARTSGVLRLEGPSEAALIFDGKEKSRSAGFEVTATEAGTGRAEIHALHRQESLGDLTFSAVVQEGVTDKATQDQEVILSRMSVRSADLTLVIQEHNENGKCGIQLLWLVAEDARLGLNLQPSDPVFFKAEPRIYFQDMFKEVEKLRLGREDTPERASSLGTNLFKAIFPADLRALLWSQRQRLRSVHILSQDPWIPWEVCKLHGEGDHGIEEGEFLCEAFSVTRWPLGQPRQLSLQLKRLGVIQQTDSGLPTAAGEHDFLLSLAAPGRTVESIPADYIQVRQMFAAGIYDGLHFVGHGAVQDTNADRSRILLSYSQELTPQDLTGRIANLGKAKPLVFLNACQAGQAAFAITGIGGWAHGFVEAGAAAFLGPHWRVQDESASRFTQIFYPKLLSAGLSIGEAVRQSRLEMGDDPTRLAYALYADPQAKVLG
jgi:CHAT domain